MSFDLSSHDQHELAGGVADLDGPLPVGLPNDALVEDWPHIDRAGRRTWHAESVAVESFDSDEPMVIVTAADRW
jgi:hypothetical protein